MSSTTQSPTKTKSIARSGRGSDSGSISDSKHKKRVLKEINKQDSVAANRKLIRRTSSLPEIEEYKIPSNTPRQERKSVHLPKLNWDAEFLESSELAENRKVAIKSTRPKHRTNGVMSLMTRTSPRKMENNITLNNSTTGAAMSLSVDPNLDLNNMRKRFSDTSDRIDSYTSSTNYSASLKEELQQNFTSFKAEMHLEFNKMRQEMRDLLDEKLANENLAKEVQELREEVQKSQKKKVKRDNSNKEPNKDSNYGSISSKKSKASPRKKINFLEEESSMAASNSSRKGTLKRVKKRENNEQAKQLPSDIYSKYDKMSSSGYSLILADLQQNNQTSNTNQHLNSTASYKELIEFQLKEKSEKYRKAKKKLKKKDKKIKSLEDQVEDWRKKCLALLEASNSNNNNNSTANINVNKPM
eukprot:TRINITY_DN3223_c0_g1_i1.p1 TRINITY_DN3223_c0_g1~~TRINITY_DN3223_c0_g1_i1.p1  ORF type:complete len:414 (-),score=63.71 TRINITY_DN3223_c0_g1_i1:26-1267(-)